jgi:hypothetical protein
VIKFGLKIKNRLRGGTLWGRKEFLKEEVSTNQRNRKAKKLFVLLISSQRLLSKNKACIEPIQPTIPKHGR